MDRDEKVIQDTDPISSDESLLLLNNDSGEEDVGNQVSGEDDGNQASGEDKGEEGKEKERIRKGKPSNQGGGKSYYGGNIRQDGRSQR
eukprot:15178884-Ditylum_brightwellii.AAC.1